MEPDFWKTRWSEGKISFHEKNPNDFLQAHVGVLGEKKRVLVPLCGKSEDMAFLASKGHEVVGIELVEDAARQFFDEHGLTPRVTEGAHTRGYHGADVTILVGDSFACTTEDTGTVDALYDRAALIALPPDARARYVPHLRALLAPGSRGVLVTVVYEQAKMEGPPFAVDEAEVRRLYAGAEVARLAPEQGRPARGERLVAIAGTEHAFALRV